MKIVGVAFTPSHGNFILLEPGDRPDPDGRSVHEQLLRRGVIVRDGAALGCPGRLRVSVGTPDENSAFLEALGKVLGGERGQSRGSERHQ